MSHHFKSILVFALGSALLVTPVYAQKSGRAMSKPGAKPPARVAPAAKSVAPSNSGRALPSTASRSRPSGSNANAPTNQLAAALQLVRQGQFAQAAPQLYTLSRRPEFVQERMQIKYILGVALQEMKLNQVAAFQFVDVIRRGDSKYVRQALEKLSIVADNLGDDTLLNYAITKIRLDEFPSAQKDTVYFRLGEIKMKARASAEAAESFAKVSPQSRYALPAAYKRGAALLEANRPNEAIALFDQIQASRAGAPINDLTRTQAQIALARAHYQAQDWDKALAYYRDIPRDSELWHDSMFESTWASLRSAKFRTTLSLLQSIHSAFYEDYFIPESLLVRGIVYLYICKFDETEKTLDLFEKTYQPVQETVARYVDTVRDPQNYFAEIEKAYTIRREKKPIEGLKLPYMVSRQILNEGDVKRSFNYLRALNEERLRLESMGNVRSTPLGVYSMKVLANRYKNTKTAIGEMVKNHLINIRNDLREYFENASFIRYETINGKKEQIKKRIAGKDVDQAIDENVQRDFYIQNGFEYWPFDGEAWIDELGNYHYLGKQNCE